MISGMSDMDTRANSRAHNYTLNDYFTLAENFDKVSVIYGDSHHLYYLDTDGLFKGVSQTDIVRFPQDGSAMEYVAVRWPAEAVFPSAANVLRDQSDRENFMKMDILEGELTNVAATTVIPVSLKHMRSKITFTLGGQYAGKKIESLRVGDFKAYCDPALNDAQLIYDHLNDIGSLKMGTNGIVKVEGVADPVNFIITESPDDVLDDAAGNCTVTLSL